jgi:hypothetical protein
MTLIGGHNLISILLLVLVIPSYLQEEVVKLNENINFATPVIFKT